MTELLLENAFAAPIFYETTTTSTMNLAKRHVDEGAFDTAIFLAGEQTASQCRIPARSWQSKADQNLLMTLILTGKSKPPKNALTLFPLKASIAVMLLLNRVYFLSSCLKWPNDVLVGGEKISGILCEWYKESLLIGMGLNVTQTEFPDVGQVVTSLALQGVKNVKPLDVLPLLLVFLKETLADEFDWFSYADARLYRKGQSATLALGNGETMISGTIMGLEKQTGKLLFVDQNANLKEVDSGEIINLKACVV